MRRVPEREGMPPVTGRGSGFGKTILVGDMFVYLGIPAIVSAIPQRTVATIGTGARDGPCVRDERPEVPGYKAAKARQQQGSIAEILRALDFDDDVAGTLTITFGGDLIAGSGVGASAASCVALVRALDDAFDLGLTDEDVNDAAWRGEISYHERPSGIDNTASCYGGIMVFQQDPQTQQNRVERLRLARPVEAVLVNSGVTVDTSTKRPFLARLEQRDPTAFRSHLEIISEQALAMRQALCQGHLAEVGSLMNANHGVLDAMGLSHPVIVELARIAAAEGALGAKVTGGGRGGYMLALTPGEELRERVAGRFEQDGYTTLRTAIGAA
jgi:mevalonate kinase